MSVFDNGIEKNNGFCIPNETDIANVEMAFAMKEPVEPQLEPEIIEVVESFEEASIMSLRELMTEACGKELFSIEKAVPLHTVSAKLMGLGYSRTVPYTRLGLLAALQDGAYVLLYLPQYQLGTTNGSQLENGGCYACRVLSADEDTIVFKDHIFGKIREISHETVSLKHPGAQLLEVYK